MLRSDLSLADLPMLRHISTLAFALALLAGSAAVAGAQALLPPGTVTRAAQPAPAPSPARPANALASAGVPLPQPKPKQIAQAQPAPSAPAAAAPVQAKPQQMAQANMGVPRASPAAPDGVATRATVDRLTAYYNSVQQLTGTFTQIDPDGSRKTGDFYMQKPGRVRFEYDSPSPIELISNGQSVAVRDRKLNTQDITPLGQTPLRFLLAERIDLAADPHVKKIYHDDRFISVQMEEQVPMMGTYRLLILFDAKTYQLKQWIVTDPQGYDTQVTLANLDASKRPDPRLFVINFERMLQ